MAKVQKSIKFIDYDYVIDEVIGKLDEGIKQLNVANDAQSKVKSIIENAKSEDKGVQEFIKITQDMCDNNKSQMQKLQYRKECLEIAKAAMSKDVKTKYICTMLLESLGAVNPEAKTLDERINNKESVIEIKEE